MWTPGNGRSRLVLIDQEACPLLSRRALAAPGHGDQPYQRAYFAWSPERHCSMELSKLQRLEVAASRPSFPPFEDERPDAARCRNRHLDNRGCPNQLLVVTAERPHPIPFRTRSLSSPAPMVLQRRRCGRVGRCQRFIREAPVPRQGGRGFRTSWSAGGASPGRLAASRRRLAAQSLVISFL